MNKKIFYLTLTIIIILISFGFIVRVTTNKEPLPEDKKEQIIKPKPTGDDSGVKDEGIETVQKGNNAFAIKFYSEIKDEEENIFFSSYSISTALAMVYEGAKSETANEIQALFGFPEDNELRRPAMAAIYNRLNPEEADYKMETANALWVQEDYEILIDFIDILNKFYLAEAFNVDFVNQREETIIKINEWVAQKTNNLIKDLFPKDSFNNLTRLVITNAIYFKGDWLNQFDKERTKNDNFYLNSGEIIEVEMMENLRERYNYFENDIVQVLEMPYLGEEISMLVFLPQNKDLINLEKNFNLDQIKEWQNNFRKEEVNLFFPKFELKTNYNLNNYLEKMGISLAFTPPSLNGADFSGITGNKDLYIFNVTHEAFISVDEEGTEAAAATGIEMGIESIPMVYEFKADHPFIFLIQEQDNGNILFVGKVMDPR